jgi:hypothetical protein
MELLPDGQWHSHAVPARFAGPVRCSEKERLIDEFRNAVYHYNILRSAQVQAVKKDQPFQFEEGFAKASERRRKAKSALLKHLEQHGC